MLSEFLVYLRLGVEHILDPRGYDHILFVVALTTPWLYRDWRPVLVQVTAFTVGHSLTLVLATLNLVRVSITWVEFLIPLTIMATAVVQLWGVLAAREGGVDHGGGAPPGGGRPTSPKPATGARITWLLALGFGLIHGLGFSNFLRAVLGSESSLLLPLFSFNVGLELGQIVVVLGMLTLSGAVARIPSVSRTLRVGVFATATALVALYLSVIRLPF